MLRELLISVGEREGRPKAKGGDLELQWRRARSVEEKGEDKKAGEEGQAGTCGKGGERGERCANEEWMEGPNHKALRRHMHA